MRSTIDHGPRLILLPLLLLAGCGDPVRVPGYEGAPVFLLNARVPVALADKEVSFALTLVNTPGQRTTQPYLTFTPDERREVRLPLRVAATDAAPPVAQSRRDGSSHPVYVMRITVTSNGLSASAGHDFLVHARWGGADLALLEPGGPAISLEAGYQLVRRRCLPDGTVTLERLPPDTVVELALDSPSWPRSYRDEEEALERCGITGVPGDIAHPDTRVLTPKARRFVRVDDAPFVVKAMAWSDAGDQLFVMTGPPEERVGTDIVVLDGTAAMPRPTRVVRGRFEPWLSIHGRGTFLFARPYGRGALVRYQLPASAPGAEPASTTYMELGPGVISPDGRRLAQSADFAPSRSTGGVVRSLDTGEERTLPYVPVAWSPDSSSLLVATARHDLGKDTERLEAPFAVVGPDGTARPLPPPPFDRGALAFWNDQGPSLLSFDFAAGVRSANLESQTLTTLLPPEQGRTAPHEVAVWSGGVVAWSRLCPGFSGKVCLSRLDGFAPDGRREGVATAGASSPFAVSPDRRRVAIGEKDAVFLVDM